jgi:N-acetyl-1-D-myo-inositol-2-amino-2-deoxy-alpha-D-glucopyranoside deacetylase
MFRRLTTSYVCLLLAALVAVGVTGCVGSSNTISLPEADLAGPRLLVIAPHPDDETVGTGGAVALARQRGWDVTVVFVTCGDGFYQAVRRRGESMPAAAKMQAYGASRAAEASRATATLGIPASNVIYLGFPDGSTHFLWGTNWDGPALVGMNGANRVPYSFAMEPRAPYTGAELESQLELIVKRVRPTTVLIPDAADVHRDHWAVNAFAQTALTRMDFAGPTLTYIVHRAGYPASRGSHPAEPLDPPSALLSNGTRWLSLPISDRARQTQSDALADYVSQLRSDGKFVRSFVRPNQVLGLGVEAVLGTGTVTLRQGRHDPHFRGGLPAATVRAIKLSRGETSSTVMLDLAAPAKGSVTYAVHVRALGPGNRIRVYEARVSEGKLSTVHTAKACVKGRGRLVGRGENAVAIQLPAELFDGAQCLFVGADTYAGGLTADHAAWRLVRISPR